MHTSARHVSAIALALGTLAASVTTHASGLEIPDNGTVAFGRGGAFVTRASDATAVIHTVAALVGLPGVQIHLGSNFGLLHHCFTRAGTYPDENESSVFNDGTVFQGSMYSRGNVPYPTVCNEPNVSVTPSLAITYRISRRVAVGFAAWGPNTTGTPQIFADRVNIPGIGLAPSPVRYMVYEKQLLMVYLQLAASFAITPWLRIGASLQPAYATFRFRTMSNAVPTAAQSPDSDLSIDLSAHGWLLAGQVATQILPSPYFSMGAQLRMNPEVHLTGTGDTVANVYRMADDQQRSQFRVDRMTVPLPWSLRAGARFELPRAGRPHNTDANYDPMTDDVFDIEATFAWEGTSRMSHVLLENSGFISIGHTTVSAPQTVAMDSNFRDVYGFRLGGDVNIVPGRFTLRAGVAYDTAAEQTQLAQIHLPGYETFSVHGGASVRFGPITATVGYAHVYMAGLNAADGIRAVTSTGGAVTMQQCEGSAGIGACQINRGVYEAALDLFSVSLNARF
jgi:long-chain fatty acid transport protein